MDDTEGALKHWIVPLAFVICAAWVIWHIPAYILTLAPHENPSLLGKVTALHEKKELSPGLPGLFGGVADIIDWATLAALPILFWIGLRRVTVAKMEFQEWRAVDRAALFVGRITMMLILLMTSVMLYEVFLRYVFEAPTLWANELTLWLGGFVFLLSGFYAMQQRSHIRIFILYELCPRWMQKLFDTVWVVLLCLFTFFMVYGSFKQVFVTKFYNWEMFGTAFDPPIPATVQPAILIVMVLIAIQAVLNLICDWNKVPDGLGGSEIDTEEIEAIKKSVGAN